MNYQFIVICADDNRKIKMKQQFEELNISAPVHYLEASTPYNSQKYLENLPQNNKNVLAINCCTKSHFRALDYAYSDENSPDFSIIIEDDASFHIQNFVKIIEYIIESWDETFRPNVLFSVGWVPCNKYSQYRDNEEKYQCMKKLENFPEYRIISNFLFPGMQVYIVKKQSIESHIDLFRSTTFFDILRKMNSLYQNEKDTFNENTKCIAIVYILRLVFRQYFLFPILAIEQRVPSLLEHDNFKDHWNKYFENNEELMNEYWHFCKAIL